MKRMTAIAAGTALWLTGAALPAAPAGGKKDAQIKCANLIYAGTKSSVCFSDKFLKTVSQKTKIDVAPKFTAVKSSSEKLFEYPFSIMTGEGSFTMLEQERRNLRSYLTRGGFLLASASCSSPEWSTSFRREFRRIFPKGKLKSIPLSHPIYHTMFDIKKVSLKGSGTTLLEGYEVDGRIVLVYSPEGLNDTPNVKGCCCCGGNEVRNCHEVNANVFTYALTH